jgi:hypothetical protein
VNNATIDPTSSRASLLRRGLRLEYLTVGWNLVERLVAVGAALAAGSVALLDLPSTASWRAPRGRC